MKSDKSYAIPSKHKLIVFTSLALTVVFSLPRLAVFRHLQTNPHIDFRVYDFLMRGLYTFLVAVLFLLLNLQEKKVSLSVFKFNPGSLYQKVIYNIVLFLILDIVLLRFHLSLFEPYMKEKLFRFMFNVNMILEVVLVIFISNLYRLLFTNQRIRLANEVLLKANAETRYEVLMNQVNPHFLFNSFNTVNALIHINKQDAVNFVNNMSDVFRYVLESSKKNLVTLKEEMQFLEAYAEMLKSRYGNKLVLLTNIHEDAQRFLLPPMALQILVENAVKHNVVSGRDPLHIDIYLSGENQLTVSNRLNEKRVPPRSTGIGLSNLNQRCMYLSGQEIIIRRTANEFSVSVPLIKPDEDINN